MSRASVLMARLAATSIERVARELGLLQCSPAAHRERATARRLRLRGLEPATVQELVDERNRCRASKDFARADALRGELAGLGIVLRDSAGGTDWSVCP